MGCTPRLIKGSRGVFDIHKDGELIYSKHQSDDQFPEHDQIIQALR
ncbi:MAG: Rdx family protein [Mariniblastus sp.]|nr:Rdx family protein [Mariniblastus sp.]